MVDVLGGKGAGLAGMSRLGVPVPPGFTIPASVCRAFYAHDETLPDALWATVERGIAHIERLRGRRFGDADAPLLVSVRSGAAVSMPGMMDTVLDVGLNAMTCAGLAKSTGQPRFAYDSHRRFLEMFAEVALGVDAAVLSGVRLDVLDALDKTDVSQLDAAGLQGITQAYRKALGDTLSAPFPTDPRAQLRVAIEGVFRSWNTRRAQRFRAQAGITDDMGTAVTVQSMVFGNLGPNSGTGVAFTRDPNTGEAVLFGEFLADAQGEDVVSGAYTPQPISALAERSPQTYAQLAGIAKRLETALGDVQDLEFTVEDGTVWMLQTRPARRSARAAVRTAVEMCEQGLITRNMALQRIEPARLNRLLHPTVDVASRRRVLARGLPASPGAVSGIAIFDPAEAIRRSKEGEAIILVRRETSAEDLDAMRAACGVLTSRGGMTSHAALVARGLGRCCVTGCADIQVNETAGFFTVRNGRAVIKAGTWLTLDGTRGEVIEGRVATTPAEPPVAFGTLMGWADDARTMGVMANADNAAEAKAALANGADGIGLVRTEHMFLGEDRLHLVREMVFAYGSAAREKVAARIGPIQRADFAEIFEVLGDRTVAIRLLDLPLHDFVPASDDEMRALALHLDVTTSALQQRAQQLLATNPSLGHRGCRLGLTFPEVYAIQVRSIFEAAIDATVRPTLQVVLPLLTCGEEMRRLRRRIDRVAATVAQERGIDVPEYTVGAMVETPRACLIAGELAEAADFFLLGANDLTAATFCINRDDASRFLPFYLDNDVLPADPFQALDLDGVGALIEIAVTRGRAARPGLVCGLAGAQASATRTVEFCHAMGVDFVTCAVHQVPLARLAAARAATADKENA
ncbi:MAG: pyruvate,orthophosphate dikinase [Bradymonadia bacterium]|jgi:pyruvate,orthophosphate dikinase